MQRFGTEASCPDLRLIRSLFWFRIIGRGLETRLSQHSLVKMFGHIPLKILIIMILSEGPNEAS